MGVLSPVVLNTMTSDAVIRILNWVGMSGVVICCKQSVIIGDHVMFGSGAVICDTDFHFLDYSIRATGGKEDLLNAASAPVVIGNDCFIGARAIVLKGVHIGERSIVAAGAVVVKSVPSDVIVAGNPARVVKRLNSENCYAEN